ncbi:hypothetical protein J6590_009436 [Homalodisca vitripennis]|nr:hypothetical protein J6590_009436 [Homalodisca vitripennis]
MSFLDVIYVERRAKGRFGLFQHGTGRPLLFNGVVTEFTGENLKLDFSVREVETLAISDYTEKRAEALPLQALLYNKGLVLLRRLMDIFSAL